MINQDDRKCVPPMTFSKRCNCNYKIGKSTDDYDLIRIGRNITRQNDKINNHGVGLRQQAQHHHHEQQQQQQQRSKSIPREMKYSCQDVLEDVEML